MKSDLILGSHELDYLLSPDAIRDRARLLFDRTVAGKTHFAYHPEKFRATVDFVLETIRKNYPDLKIPFHSRWGHFRAGGIDRAKQLDQKLAPLKAIERARVKLDLVITSVLLDAGAGASWKFREEDGKYYGRSEGLGVASFHMFLAGAFSNTGRGMRAERDGLARLAPEMLREHFQVSVDNPLVGVEGRVQLLNNLARALENQKIFRDGRPGNIIDYVHGKYGDEIPARGLLRAVLDGLGPIWPGRITANGVNLGDVWRHSQLGGGAEGLVPFHKLSQWMTYSLIEPIEESGLAVSGVHELTGLAEYRNGGLFIDSGLISLRDSALAKQAWEPASDLVIEWRALTVHLLDLVGEAVQESLGKSPVDFPLAKVLEGGTWWAGRRLAQKRSPEGEPPLQIKSDGTVF